MQRAKKIAEQVTDREKATSCRFAKTGTGYRIVVPFTKQRVIDVRIMARSKARKNYYRVDVSGKGSVDKDGNPSDKAEDTHHKLTDDAVGDIHQIIEKIKDKHRG